MRDIAPKKKYALFTVLRGKHHLTSVRCNSSGHAAFIMEYGLLEILKFITLNFTECTHCRATRLFTSNLSVRFLQLAPVSGSHRASNGHLECKS